jgi:DNA-binding NarL/FixJ family response regulator
MTLSAVRIRILCVDDHAFLIEGLQARFVLESDLEIVGVLHSADDLLEEAKRLRPNIVLMDISMSGADPFEAITDLKRVQPDARVIMLSGFVRDHYLDLAVAAGAWGYVSKSEDPTIVMQTIRKVAAGMHAFSNDVQQRCATLGGSKKRNGAIEPDATASSRLNSLTAREEEVLRFIGKGLSRSDIARTLHRSPKTIDAHRASIMEKMNIHDRVALALFAVREGLV